MNIRYPIYEGVYRILTNKVMDCSGLYDGLKDLNEYLTKTKENK